MTYALAVSVALAITLPHMLPLHRVKPAAAIALWLGALALRASSGIMIVSGDRLDSVDRVDRRRSPGAGSLAFDRL